MISPVAASPVLSPAAEPAGSATAPPVPPAKAKAAANPVGPANPTFRFNPAAGVLVIQFRDESGKVALSIPSQQQITAYTADRVEGQPPSSDSLIA